MAVDQSNISLAIGETKQAVAEAPPDEVSPILWKDAYIGGLLDKTVCDPVGDTAVKIWIETFECDCAYASL
jgi:hypothetical protein